MSRDFCSKLFKRLHEGFFGDRSIIQQKAHFHEGYEKDYITSNV